MKSDKLPRAHKAWCVVSSTIGPAGSLILCAALAGCATAPLARQSTAFSAALAPVLDQSTETYRQAEATHNLLEDYLAVVAYQNKDATYNPRNAPELLTDKDIQTRLAVLSALQIYSQSLIQITNSVSSPQLDEASKSVGNSLTGLGNDLAPSIENVLGIEASPSSTTTTTVTTVSGDTTTTSTTTASATLSPQVRNGISTAVNALGQFLVSRKIGKELPGKIEQMDPNVEALCEALAGDLKTVGKVETRDYDQILDLEKQFILEDEKPGSNASPELLRAEIMKLPEIARQQTQANDKLDALRKALLNLEMTHHALAAEAQHNNPQSFNEKLKELADAGSNLGKFYSSLPAK